MCQWCWCSPTQHTTSASGCRDCKALHMLYWNLPSQNSTSATGNLRIYSSQAIRTQGTAGYDAETSLTQCCKLNRLNRTKIDIEHCWLDQVHLQHHTKRLFRYQKREQYIWILQVKKLFLKSIITTYSSSLVPRPYLYGRDEKGEGRKGLVNNSTPTRIHGISFMFNNC